MARNANPVSSSISRLAGLIEIDLGKRELKPGDPYMTSSEAARLHGVSTMTASRAMALLADRSVLVRKRKLGTRVGPNVARRTVPALKFLHLLVSQDYLRTEGLLADGVINGLHAELPGTDIQFNFLPPRDSLAYVRQVTDQSSSRGIIEGMVLIRCALDIHRFIEQSRLPAVVYGSVYPGSTLPWVDRNQVDIGRKAAEFLIRRGSRRLAVLTRSDWRPGDNRTIGGVLAGAGAAGLRADAVQIRSIPEDIEVGHAVVRDLLSQGNDRMGLVCRSRLLADVARDVAAELGRRTHIVLCDYYAQRGEPCPYPYACPEMDGDTQGRLMGKMLAQLADGSQPDPANHLIPIAIEEPTSNSN